MSTAVSTYISNRFKVKDKEFFKEVIESFYFNFHEHEDGKVNFTYDGLNSPLWTLDKEMGGERILDKFDTDYLELPKAIAECLQDGEIAVIRSIAHCQTRWVHGHAFIVNSEGEYEDVSLMDIEDEIEVLTENMN